MKARKIQEYLIIIISLVSFIKSELVIIGPSDLASRYYNKPIELVFGKLADLSNFYVHGEILFENKTTMHTACTELGPLNINANQNEYNEDYKILLAYNGECSIIQKARNVQSAGGSMLLLINNNDQDIKDVILEDDGSGNDIKIPIGLISLSNGRIMQNFIENNPKSRIMVEINFKPKPEPKKIEVKIFFSSSELKAYDLINNMMKYLDKFTDQVDLIPIYVSHQSPNYNQENPQRELNCITKGKYCYFPKETTIIQDGQRILMESLRQKCMYVKSEENKKYYYNYLQSFSKECLNTENVKFNERCSQQVLDYLGFPMDYLDECMAESFGVNNLLSSSYIDNENKIFEKDYNEILKYKITSFPAVVVGDKPIEGIIKESKIVIEICKLSTKKPIFCPILTGIKAHLIKGMNKKRRIYYMIGLIIVINIILFFIFRKYIKRKINEKINFNTIDFEGRVNNFVKNYFSLNKNREMDYKSFDTDASSKNNKGYSRLEGSVNTM